MSNWITITKADLYNSKVAALIDAADTASLGQGQQDRSSGVMADITLEIRRRVAKENRVDADPSKIPGGLKPLALDLIFCRLKVALELELTEDERRTLERRERELDRIADGQDVIEPPDNPMAENPLQSLPRPAFGRRQSEWRRGSLEG